MGLKKKKKSRKGLGGWEKKKWGREGRWDRGGYLEGRNVRIVLPDWGEHNQRQQ